MALNPKGFMGSPKPTHQGCPACGHLAPIGMNGHIGAHGDGACKATGQPFQALRGVARLAGSWAVRWKDGSEWRETPCGEREAPREAIRLGGVSFSPAVRKHLGMED